MQPEPRRQNTIVLVVLGIALGSLCLCSIPVLAAILFPVFAQAREKARATQCMNNLKQQSRALLMYAADYADRLPPATRWGDAISPKIPDPITFRCPAVVPGKFGYAMNSALSRKSLSAIESPHTTPMLYDSSNLGWNAHDAFASLPNPPRHLGKTNNVAYADGHVRAVPGRAP